MSGGVKFSILNDQKEVTTTSDLSKYIEFASKAENSIVGKTVVGSVEISTVFLSQPKFSFDPVGTNFETMIFDLVRGDEISKDTYPGWPDEIPSRSVYERYFQAEEGHRYIVHALTEYFDTHNEALSPCEL